MTVATAEDKAQRLFGTATASPPPTTVGSRLVMGQGRPEQDGSGLRFRTPTRLNLLACLEMAPVLKRAGVAATLAGGASVRISIETCHGVLLDLSTQSRDIANIVAQRFHDGLVVVGPRRGFVG